MCGRFTQTHKLEALIERFGLEVSDMESPAAAPSWNVAPGQWVPAVLTEPELHLARLRWGLVPSWAKEATVGYRMINARSETAREKPAFRRLVGRRRCLVPADGFFEWKKRPGGGKQPWYFSLKNHGLFAFAGLWDRWEQDNEKPLFTCTLLTTTPNGRVAPVHDRMPVILRPRDETIWLGEGDLSDEWWSRLCAPFPAEEMVSHPVSTLVNSLVNHSPDCIEPVPEDLDPGPSGQLELL